MCAAANGAQSFSAMAKELLWTIKNEKSTEIEDIFSQKEFKTELERQKCAPPAQN
jgi:hypothetical protein